MSDYLFDGKGSDPEVEALEQSLSKLAHEAPLGSLPARPRSFRPTRVGLVVGVFALAAACVLAIVFYPRPEPVESEVAEREAEPQSEPAVELAIATCTADASGFGFSSSGGSVRCDGAPAQAGVLPVGAWLETGPSDAAELAVADIGSLTIHGDSRVRLVGTGPDQHRLELARGRVSASVVAPPRLFVVDTPAATAVDLGCAYELDVDETARTRLHVTSGAVSLERGETVAWVPAGYQVTAEKGKGPGLPIAVAAGAALRDAAGRFDGGEASALATLVELAGEEDVGMLWNLLGRTDRTGREAVLARLAALRPLPGDLAAEKIRAGDPATLENLREVLEADLFE